MLEIEDSRCLLFYGHVRDKPWKGALVEVGMALAMRKPVYAVVIGKLDGVTHRPIGSWIEMDGVKRYGTLDDALKDMAHLELIPQPV